MDETNELKITKDEHKRFGQMYHINHHFRCFDYDYSINDYSTELNSVEQLYECGCKVITYDNYAKDRKQRSVYSEQRFIENKIIKAKNCEMHQRIVDKRKKLLKKLKKLEDDYGEVIPRVIRTVGKHCYSEHVITPEDQIITQTVEL
jgi:hypothetical protein